MTVLSTSATSGTEMLDRIIGAASAQTLWWVGRWRQSAESWDICIPLRLGAAMCPLAGLPAPTGKCCSCGRRQTCGSGQAREGAHSGPL
ncbi:hypothetical protein D3C80_1443430 [compost metagenome]